LAVFNDGRVLSYGTMGGDAQTQFQAQIFTRYADFRMGLADAVDAPRWILGKAWGAPAATLKLEDRFDPGLIRALKERGHEVEELGGPYRDSLGHAGMLVKHRRDGRVEATHDPRADGGALGL
jgi:gamma-glutamyltranspeptidase/glutathione hydrolase